MFQYHRLKPDTDTATTNTTTSATVFNIGVDHNIHEPQHYYNYPTKVRILARLKRVRVRRRVRLRSPWLRQKARLVAAAFRKIVTRLKEGQGHWGDLFSGNYLFLQVNPSNPASAKAKCGASDKSNIASSRSSAYYINPARSAA